MPPRDDVMPDVLLRRILSRGDLPGSDGGIYNPGALLTDEGIVLLARREIDYRFTPIVHAERIVLDSPWVALSVALCPGYETVHRRSMGL